MMWVFMGLVVVEAAVVHFLIALWWPLAALLLSLLSLATIVWLVALIRSFRRLPVEIGEGRLVWRCGILRSVEVPLAQLGGLRAEWDGALVKERTTLNLALIAYPNVVVELAQPLMLGRRSVTRLAHRLDDPAAFVSALTGLLPTA